jgi:hypothetical protein
MGGFWKGSQAQKKEGGVEKKRNFHEEFWMCININFYVI